MTAKQLVDGVNREVAQVLVIDRIELHLVDQVAQVWKLELDDTVVRQQVRGTSHEPVQVGDVGEDVVAENHVGSHAFVVQSSSELAGEFPKGTKFGVTISRYSMGCSLSVNIRELPGVELVEKYDDDWGTRIGVSGAATVFVDKAEAIVMAYKFDDSDSMVDYFHVNFYHSVGVDYRAEHAARDVFLAKEEAVAEAA